MLANRTRLGPADALRLARDADRVVTMKGTRVVSFDMRKDKPSDEALLAVMLGPTGMLRAPVVRIGRTVLVGFSPESYRAALTP